MLASELARHLSVSPSTITNWATRHQPPLAFEFDRGRRLFSLDDYNQFADAHSKLRGVAKQAMTEAGAPTTLSDPELLLLEVRERLRSVLEQIDAVQEGSAKTRKSAARLKREVAAALRLLAPAGKTGIDG